MENDNAKLQQKKAKIREKIRDAGVLEKKGTNDFDHYKYFTEAQYKELFTALLTGERLELQVSEKDVAPFEGSAKQPFGWRVTLDFILHDIDTGFSEVSQMSGIGMDKGDKGIYKAYTGALKYYLANTFMVATGDDPEKADKGADKKITAQKVKTLGNLILDYGLDIADICQRYDHTDLAEFSENEYANCLKRLEATRKEMEGQHE